MFCASRFANLVDGLQWEFNFGVTCLKQMVLNVAYFGFCVIKKQWHTIIVLSRQLRRQNVLPPAGALTFGKKGTTTTRNFYNTIWLLVFVKFKNKVNVFVRLAADKWLGLSRRVKRAVNRHVLSPHFHRIGGRMHVAKHHLNEKYNFIRR